MHAVEIDPAAAAVYRGNWGLDPLGDITEQASDDVVAIPEHDVLAAGFPCQPFSKSGAQRGMDEARGTLFWNIARIIEVRRPAVVLLENVRNLAGPRHAHELQIVHETLRSLGYRVSEVPAVFSPHLLPPEMGGRPQVRERVFVTATYNPEGVGDGLPVDPVASPRPVAGWKPQDWDLEADLPLDPDHHVMGCDLTDDEVRWIDAWNAFVEMMWELRDGRRLPGFPLWADDWVHADDLHIPRGTPTWKADFLRKNAEFYTAHQEPIDEWKREWRVDDFPPSRRKLEWQAQDTARLWDCVMHMRPSGIRAKRPTYLPALVAITQTSIIGSRQRRLSPREAARLQSLPDWFSFGDQPSSATYRQLGNGVSAGAVWYILRQHVERDYDVLKTTAPHLLRILDLPDNPDPLLAGLHAVKRRATR